MSSRWRSSSSSEGGRARSALPVLLFLALAAAVAGCSAFDVLGDKPGASGGKNAPSAVKPPRAAPPPVEWKPAPAPDRIAFSHKFHLGRGTTCDDCHEGADKAVKAPMPNFEFCADCHTEIDAEKPKEKTLAAFLGKDGKTPVWSAVTAQPADITFSHAVHAAKKVACAECHVGIEESEAVSKALFVDMDACTKCHVTKKAKNECATCHKGAAKSVAEGKGPFVLPANHDKSWTGVHGVVSRLAAPRTRAERCDDCHGKPQFPAKSDCATCHAATKPVGHDAAWRAAHGADVRGDIASVAERCGTCHDNSAFPAAGRCDTCHVSTRPADHERLWNDLHGQAVRRTPEAVTGRCAFCHDAPGFPSESRCSGCHATEPPRDHSQSWRTGGGHGLAAALDRGRCEACHTPDTCTACHKTAEPRSHRGGWGAPRDRHCVGCHLPLRADSPDGCAVCHEGTPSHASAPRLPSSPPHPPDSTCRKCHAGPKLKHADNGTNCVVCHR